MKLIIEGPNNVGKSTLIHVITEIFNTYDFEVEHLSNLTPNTTEFHKDLLKLPKNVIFDRFCLSEIVYAPIFGRKPKFTLEESISIVNEFKDDTIVVLVDADYEFMVKAYKNKQEEFDYEFVKQEKVGFQRLKQALKEAGIPFVTYKNYKENQHEYNKFLGNLNNLLRKLEDSYGQDRSANT